MNIHHDLTSHSKKEPLRLFLGYAECFDELNINFIRKKGLNKLNKPMTLNLKMGKYFRKFLMRYKGHTLNKFRIDARFHRFSENESYFLGKLIASWKNLKSVQLIFENSYSCGVSVNDLGLHFLTRGLQYIKNIESVSIDLKRCVKITEEGIIGLFKKVSKYAKLENLDLNLAACRSVMQKGFYDSWDPLPHFKSLKRLAINLSWCPIRNDGLSQLLQKVSLLRNSLCCFELDLESCHNVISGNFYNTFHPVKELIKIQTLRLNFKGVPNIDNDRILSLFQCVEQFKELSCLEVNLTWCLVTDDALPKLSNLILNIPKLRVLEINFRGCRGLTEEEATKFIDTLKGIPRVTNLQIHFF